MKCHPLILRLSLLVIWSGSARGQECERLKRTETYTQEAAPRDLSAVLPVVVEKVNQELEGVVDVEIDYHGDDLQARVGEHLIKCSVTRLASALPDDMQDQTRVDDYGREVATQCFLVPFTILDTNECKLPLSHPMRHKCQSPSRCVNTNGSYECICPKMDSQSSFPSVTVDEPFWKDLAGEDRTPWEVSYNSTSRTSCPSMASTHGCCPERPYSKSGMSCRANFRCPPNPCEESNDCAASATCVRKETPNAKSTFTCQCPEGLMGNGHRCRPGEATPKPKVRFDGVTPTDETIKNNYYCDCTKPVVDACSGFPPCKGKHEICMVSNTNVPRCGCEPGYVMHEKYGCVDENPPIMKLRHDPDGDQTLRLKQGDVYKEYAVDIEDENAEEYMRSLKIAYSRPLPYGCLVNIGEFHVNYTIATPWTTPPNVRLTRRVIIGDINECTLDQSKYDSFCPPLIPKCDTEAGATCVNKIGSYACQCPKYTTGDGFLAGLSFKENTPVGFKGGTGCVDTSKPLIELKGPNPKVFRISQCGALNGIMSSQVFPHDGDLKTAQQKYYGDDVKTMIRQTAGAELCATHRLSRPNASDCVKAYDQTYKGRIDLSREVVVGDPVQTSALQWRVPYDVQDAAGNKADTVWRDVVVDEVNLLDVEAKIHQDYNTKKQEEIRAAVDKALADERKKGSRRSSSKVECPACPTCNCATDGSFDVSMCDPVCKAREQVCTIDMEVSTAVRIVQTVESYVPAPVVTIIIGFFAVYFAFAVLRLVFSIFASPRYAPAYNVEEREQGLRNHITEFSPQPQMNGGAIMQQPQQQSSFLGSPPGNRMSPAPPRGPPLASASLYGDSVFSPTPRSYGANGNIQQNTPGGTSQDIDIYASSPIITPNKQGNGLRQRSPFGR